ncbi:MAG: 50S ribosomal protein L24 [Alphaproteobacteria bacterium]|nr:50S ribosomal protein L24 [Alphaproteobacteria bacterium]
MKIKKDDEVIVVTGRDRGKQGKVLRAMPEKNRVLVQGVNIVKRHTKPSQADPQGGIKEKEAPIHVSNVALVDPKTSRPTRVGFKILTDGRKVRVAKRSGEVIDV